MLGQHWTDAVVPVLQWPLPTYLRDPQLINGAVICQTATSFWHITYLTGKTQSILMIAAMS